MPPSFGLRAYQSSDAPRVVDVFNANITETLGARRAVVDGVGNVRLIRYVPPTSEKVVVITPDEQIVGFAYVVDRDQAIVHEVGGAVDPNYWGQGIGTLLLEWAEQRSRTMSEQAPAAVKTVLQANIFATDQRAIDLFTSSGYARVRNWVHLSIELDAEPPLPHLPDGLTLREMDLENDWDIVSSAMEETFVDIWGSIPPHYTHEEEDEAHVDVEAPEDDSYSNAPGYCFLVLKDDLVVGGILSNAKLVEQPGSGRIGSVFVRPGYRRLGIGRILILSVYRAFWEHDVRRIILDTDADSFSQAPLFYGSLGMQMYRHEYLFEKEVRPGKEIRRLSQ